MMRQFLLCRAFQVCLIVGSAGLAAPVQASYEDALKAYVAKRKEELPDAWY